MAMSAAQPLESTLRSTSLKAIHHTAQHLRVWLAGSGLSYGCAARGQFIRAHPPVLGSACDLTGADISDGERDRGSRTRRRFSPATLRVGTDAGWRSSNSLRRSHRFGNIDKPAVLAHDGANSMTSERMLRSRVLPKTFAGHGTRLPPISSELRYGV
jgi:hypothetical protein